MPCLCYFPPFKEAFKYVEMQMYGKGQNLYSVKMQLE